MILLVGFAKAGKTENENVTDVLKLICVARCSRSFVTVLHGPLTNFAGAEKHTAKLTFEHEAAHFESCTEVHTR